MLAVLHENFKRLDIDVRVVKTPNISSQYSIDMYFVILKYFQMNPGVFLNYVHKTLESFLSHLKQL